MNTINRILRLAKRIPNQILMQDGFIIIKTDNANISSIQSKEGTKMTVTIHLDSKIIKNITL